MTRDKAYLIGTNDYSFNKGIPAEIIGVEMITPDKGTARLCYHIVFGNLTEDWIPIEDTKNYTIISLTSILEVYTGKTLK